MHFGRPSGISPLLIHFADLNPELPADPFHPTSIWCLVPPRIQFALHALIYFISSTRVDNQLRSNHVAISFSRSPAFSWHLFFLVSMPRNKSQTPATHLSPNPQCLTPLEGLRLNLVLHPFTLHLRHSPLSFGSLARSLARPLRPAQVIGSIIGSRVCGVSCAARPGKSSRPTPPTDAGEIPRRHSRHTTHAEAAGQRFELPDLRQPAT